MVLKDTNEVRKFFFGKVMVMEEVLKLLGNT